MKQPEIITDRLLLRSFNLNDATEVQKLAGNYNVSKTTLNIPFPYEPGMAEEWINTHSKNWNNKSGVAYAVTLKETNQLVGAISLVKIDGAQAELGYWIGELYWGNGYCTEAATALINLSFEKLRLNTIVAEHLTSNPASGKVMEKAGMHHIETKKKTDRNQNIVAIEFYEIRNI